MLTRDLIAVDNILVVLQIMGGSIVVYFGFDEKTNASSDELIEGLEVS